MLLSFLRLPLLHPPRAATPSPNLAFLPSSPPTHFHLLPPPLHFHPTLNLNLLYTHRSFPHTIQDTPFAFPVLDIILPPLNCHSFLRSSRTHTTLSPHSSISNANRIPTFSPNPHNFLPSPTALGTPIPSST